MSIYQRRPPRHPTALGWERPQDLPPQRTQSDYNPLPASVRLAIGLSKCPAKIVSAEEAKELIVRSLPGDDLLSRNIRAVKAQSIAAESAQAQKGDR